MTEPVIIALILSSVALLLGGFILFTKAEEEARIFELREKVSALIDWQIMHGQKIRDLQAQFTELVYRQDRKLWEKLGLTKPAGYPEEKIDIQLIFENHGLEKTFKELAEKVSTIRNEHLSKLEDHPGIEGKMKIDQEAKQSHEQDWFVPRSDVGKEADHV